MKIKKLINIFIIFFFLFTSLKAEEYKIVASVNEKIITNYDLRNEVEILKILNNNPNLKYSQIYQTAINGILDEKIKKIELKKQKIEIEDKIVQKYYEIFLKNSKYNTNHISNYHKNIIMDKIKTDLEWNQLISKLYSWKININMNEINEKIRRLNNKQQDEKKIDEIKTNIINEETNKKLNVFSKYHFLKIKKLTLIKYY